MELPNGFIGKGNFEIRLTEPILPVSAPTLVNGLEELFHQRERSTVEPLTFLICSAWLSAETFDWLGNSLEGSGHHLFIYYS